MDVDDRSGVKVWQILSWAFCSFDDVSREMGAILDKFKPAPEASSGESSVAAFQETLLEGLAERSTQELPRGPILCIACRPMVYPATNAIDITTTTGFQHTSNQEVLQFEPEDELM